MKCQVHFGRGKVPAAKFIVHTDGQHLRVCEKCAIILKKDAAKDEGRPHYIPLTITKIN